MEEGQQVVWVPEPYLPCVSLQHWPEEEAEEALALVPARCLVFSMRAVVCLQYEEFETDYTHE